MYDEIIELAENRAYLNAMRQDSSPNLEMMKTLKPFEQLRDFEEELKAENQLTFDKVFHEPTGYYLLKCFLTADYSVDKAVFVSDVELFGQLRDTSARRKVGKLIYDRYLDEEDSKYSAGESVFANKKTNNKKSVSKEPRNQSSKVSQDVSSNDKDPSTQSGDFSIGGLHSEGSYSHITPDLKIGTTNCIGVYGKPIRRVREQLNMNKAPKNLFHEVLRAVLDDLRMDVFPRFLKSEFYKKYIQCKAMESQSVSINSFSTLRTLGTGAFGTVNACVKKDSGKLYAMKCLNKKQIMGENQIHAVLEERQHLSRMNSDFVVCLKYAVEDSENFYLIEDLMSGGNLKYHLNRDDYFTEPRAKYYAAEILLGLQHIHELGIMYRDIKLENMLLDERGHVKISDLGLSVKANSARGYAGTPGYTAPEVCKGDRYDKTSDFFSYGVLIYRFLSGKKPFGHRSGDLDENVKRYEPEYPQKYFSEDAVSLIKGLLIKDPKQRLGHGSTGIDDIKSHRWFRSLDFGLLAAGYIDPPWMPDPNEINAESLRHLGNMNAEKYKRVKLNDAFRRAFADFNFKSVVAMQKEIVEVMEYQDREVDFRKFVKTPGMPSHGGSESMKPTHEQPIKRCCVIC